MANNIKTALEFLKDGQSFNVGDLRLGIDSSSGYFKVIGWSQYVNFTNLTKKNSLKELEDIKAIFFEMVNASIELKNFIQNKPMEFILCFDDYGKASIDICSERNGVIKWEIELN